MHTYKKVYIVTTIVFCNLSCVGPFSRDFKGWELKPMSSAALLKKIEPQMPSYTLPAFAPEDIYAQWWSTEEFYPTDAVRLPELQYDGMSLIDTPRISCPGTGDSMLPAGFASLRCETIASGPTVTHQLRLAQKEHRLIVPVYFSKDPFEAIWSVDGLRFVVSHFRPLRPSVTSYDLRDGITSDVVISRPTLENYLALNLAECLMYVRAQGWAGGSHLVVRAIGRVNVPPFDQFGVEVLIDMDVRDTEGGTRILRGSIRRAGEPSAAN